MICKKKKIFYLIKNTIYLPLIFTLHKNVNRKLKQNKIKIISSYNYAIKNG